MPGDSRIWDGTEEVVASDSETHPSFLPNNFDWITVNRIMRGGKRRLRPPFTELTLQVASGQDPNIITAFRTGNFQGAYAYQSIKYGSQDGIAVSVAGTIYYIAIVNNIGYLYELATGNEPGMMHTWFVQAEDWLYIQNGYQNPIAWDGDLSGKPTNLQALGIGSSEIQLTWTDNTFTEVGFEIQYLTGSGGFVTADTTGPNVTSYIFTGAPPGTNYTFQVRAVFPDGSSSPWSNTATTASDNVIITPEFPDSLMRLNPAAGQMPIGTIMEYAYGRVWVSDANNNIYASDIIFGDGFTNTANTQNFTEQQYWNEGGSFTPPARLGQITGMKIMPSINVNDRGQGELVVACENGFFTLNGSILREDWIDNNIQKVALFGRGNRSPWSTTGINNEMFFRADDGWSLYSNSQLDFNQRLSFRKLSREVNRWVDGDTPWMRQFASAMYFDNRLIATVSPYTVSNANPDQGLHRPHRAMVVLDLDQTSVTAPDSQLNFRWNGLWEGPQPTQLLTAQIRGQQRGFCFSFDADGVNRLYELQISGVNDFVNGQNKKIKSYFITKRYDFSGSEQTNKFLRKNLNGGELWISEVPEQIDISVKYRPDSYPCYGELMPEIQFGCSNCDFSLEENCTPVFSQNRFRPFKFPTPNSKECQVGLDIPLPQGAEFQVLVEMEGKVTIDRMRISADTRGNVDIPFGECPTAAVDCVPIVCCPMKELEYYRIVE